MCLAIEEIKQEAVEEATQKICIENAKKLFKNGVDYELVRNSIEHLTDEQLKSIYDEVMASKQTSN